MWRGTRITVETESMNTEGQKIRGGRSSTVLVAGAGLLITAAVYLATFQLERHRAQSDFRALAGQPIAELQRAIDLYSEELQSIGNLYAASERVERHEFRAFVRGIISHRSAVQALIWAPQVPHTQRQRFEQGAAAENLQNFRISERNAAGTVVAATLRTVYYPVWFVQPLPRDPSIYGRDIGVEPGFRETLPRARDRGVLLATDVISALGDPRGRSAIALVLPIYAHNTPATADATLRREHLQGFIVGIFRIEELVSEALSGWRNSGVRLQLREVEGTLIYGEAEEGYQVPPSWQCPGRIRLPGAEWRALCIPTWEYFNMVRPRRAWASLIVGLVLTILSAAYVHTITGRAAWAARLVTERTAELSEANRQLEASRERYRMLVQTMNEGLSVLDEEGRLTYVNDAFCRMLGYEREELLGHRPEKLLDPPNRAILLEQLERRKRGEDAPYELDWQHKDGHFISTIVSPRPLMDQTGVYRGTFAVITDVTSLKQAQQELAQALEEVRHSNAELESFAYIASHDLQEPLRKIVAFGDRLKARIGETLDERAQDYLARMQNAAGRMQGFINDLLTYSRVTTKAQPFVPVDLGQIAREVISDLETRIEELNGRVEIGELPTIEADPLQMRQLLQNLIGNGLKFHREGLPPVVTISAQAVNEVGEVVEWRAPNALCRLEVSDNGIGFEPQYAERIFGVFQRLHGRGEYEGTGIGLAVCRKIVERHGGTISAHSMPNEGATFIVTLPVHHNLGVKL
ncbi:MAG: CHASE domain-containing protein [Candidatus Zipacnadales bacterium]